jgi:small-conductance mechanosensitive channel/CRP-like cAMP-binding protein
VGTAASVALWLVAAWLATRALDAFLWRRFERGGAEPAVPRIVIHLAAGAVYVATLMVIVAVVLDQPLTGLLVSSTVVAGVVGLALQGTLTDLLAGIAISIDRLYGIGDWLEVEGGFTGQVVDVTWRSTRLVSWNDSIYVIPNSRAARAVVHNLNLPTPRYGRWFSIWLPAEVAPRLARQLMLEACLSSPEVLRDPAPTVRLRDLGRTPVEYRVFAYFRDYPSHIDGLDDLLERIWVQLQRLGIEPAAPVQDLRLRRGTSKTALEPADVELLRRVELFRHLGEGERRTLLERSERRTCRSGEVIVREGEAGASLFVVASGVARVLRSVPGRADVELARLSVYDYFGEMSLLTGEPRSATVTALTECSLVVIDKVALDEVLRARPRLVSELAETVNRRRDRASRLVERMGAAAAADDADHLHLLVARIRGFFGLGHAAAEGGHHHEG